MLKQTSVVPVFPFRLFSYDLFSEGDAVCQWVSSFFSPSVHICRLSSLHILKGKLRLLLNPKTFQAGVSRSAVPNLFWHQGLVLWKTVFPWTREGGGCGMIQARYIYCALYLLYYYISSTSGHQALDPGAWGPLVWVKPYRNSHLPSLFHVASFLCLQ